MKAQAFKSSLLFQVLAALTACGGGGGGSAPPATSQLPGNPPVIDVPVSLPSTIVTSPQVSSFAVGSPEREALDFLNAERLRDGFGTVAENSFLYAAAKGHADYQILNGETEHFQVSGRAGFTGFSPSDRVAATGYTASGAYGGLIDEIAFLSDSLQNKNAFGGAFALKALLNAPLHMSGLLSGIREVGIAVSSERDLGVSFPPFEPAIVTQINGAYKTSTGAQLPASSEVLVYPCNGATGVARELRGESPNPVPGRDLSVNPLGRSMLVYVRPENTLAITTYSMVATASGAPVVLRAPATPLFGGTYQQYIAADAPNAANTTYTFTVSGTNNGNAFSKTCQFTTGS